jgi:hypothetical protein
MASLAISGSSKQFSSSSTSRAVVAESRAHASSMGDARRAMELSRERMYAERSKRNRTIMLYTTGSVSLCLTNLEMVVVVVVVVNNESSDSIS